jgi:hypothetical protein
VPGADDFFSLHSPLYQLLCTSIVSRQKGRTNPFIRRPVFTSQIFLGVNNQPLSPGKRLLEQRIPRREWDAIVAAFDDEVDGGEHRLHLGEPGSMMAEEVGAWKIEL